MHEFTEDIDGFGGNHRSLPGFCGQGLSLFGIATAIIAEPQDYALLPQPGHLGDVKVIELEVGKVLSLDVPRVLLNFWKIEDEKQAMRFEIAKL